MPYCIACVIGGLFLDVQYCREEQNLILNSICQPQNALQCDKAVGEIQTIRPGGKKYDNLPKNVCRNFSLLMKFEYLQYFKIQPTPSGSGGGLNIKRKKTSHSCLQF